MKQLDAEILDELESLVCAARTKRGECIRAGKSCRSAGKNKKSSLKRQNKQPPAEIIRQRNRCNQIRSNSLKIMRQIMQRNIPNRRNQIQRNSLNRARKPLHLSRRSKREVKRGTRRHRCRGSYHFLTYNFVPWIDGKCGRRR